ncbi:MAG TPA: zf-HC2 domain-containing protein [Candidatus Cybelea sp.]|nr:zf-HC2 domain-containing protein [Candidatus Cybelea sp.]
MMHEQVADLAELYALGALGDSDRAAVDEHVRRCATCAQLLAGAERDVALIASMEPQHAAPRELEARVERTLQNRPQAWPYAAAIAAAVAIGLLPSLYILSQTNALHRSMLAQAAATERLAGAPHRMAHFRTTPGMPPAEIVYAPDGSWYLVLVHGAAKTLSVAWMHDGTRTMLGDAVPQGHLASLYLPKSHRMDRIALMDGDRVVAEATLNWQKTSLSHPTGRFA